MKVLITGSSGLIGSALAPFLAAKGDTVIRLVRPVSRPAADQLVWDPLADRLDAALLEGFEGVVHLAGENIGTSRWTPSVKSRLRDSRVKGTRLLAETLVRLAHPPGVLVSASAIGYYGDRGDEVLTEDSPPGTGFLPETCREWEAAAQLAAAQGIRVVNLRSGMILAATGGALARMLPPFKLGVGGVVGSGRQYVSWITLDDVIAAVHHALTDERLRGAVNAVAPAAVTNREFTNVLGHVLHRPTLLPAPAFALRLALGELADALLLASSRVSPARLQATGFAFGFPDLEGALRHVLGKEH